MPGMILQVGGEWGEFRYFRWEIPRRTNRWVEAHISVRGRILTAINCSLRIRFVCPKISGFPRTRTYSGDGMFRMFQSYEFSGGVWIFRGSTYSWIHFDLCVCQVVCVIWCVVDGISWHIFWCLVIAERRLRAEDRGEWCWDFSSKILSSGYETWQKAEMKT